MLTQKVSGTSLAASFSLISNGHFGKVELALQCL